MAGKLSIRRVGNFLPSMCLAGVLLVIAVIIYLCTVGLPDCALRYIEAEAAKQGVKLQIETIKLSPKSGLAAKAEQVELELPQAEAPPIRLTARKVLVSFSLTRMLTGDLRPYSVSVMGRKLHIPYGAEAEEELILKDIELYASFIQNSEAIQASLKTDYNDISLEAKLLLTQPEKALELPQITDTPAEPDKPLDIKSYLKLLRKELARQNWDKDNQPLIKISAVQGKEWKADLEASIPSYNSKHFQFREANLKASIRENGVEIEKLNFRTIEPDSIVSLQASYDWTDRELEFSTKSTAPLLRILRDYQDEELPELLSIIQADEGSPPLIELSGTASLSEDYALNRIALRGKLDEKKLNLGRTHIKHLKLDFFMSNGQFIIDTVDMKLEEGYIKAAAHASGGKGEAKIVLSLPDETLLTLAEDFAGIEKLALPEGLVLDSNLNIKLQCNMQVAPFAPGQSHFEDLIPTLESVSLQIDTAQAKYKSTKLELPNFKLLADGLQYNEESVKARLLTVDTHLTVSDEEQNILARNLNLTLKAEEFQLAEHFNRIHADMVTYECHADDVKHEIATLETLNTTGSITGIDAQLDNIVESLRSGSIETKCNVSNLAYGDNSASELYLYSKIPAGLNLGNAWKHMQTDAHVEASVQEIRSTEPFLAKLTKFSLNHVAQDTIQLKLTSSINEEPLSLVGTAMLKDDARLELSSMGLQLPAASLKPLFGGEPLQELKLPGLVKAEGSATIDTNTCTVQNCTYRVTIPELIRVCRNVYVHQGMEIPLGLEVEGHFSTAPDGNMHYDARVQARHALGELDINVNGNPLKDCHVTGRNTIPVDIINALIDNADAHWIMRDFRCKAGVTRNVIDNIDATIRYDKGIYVFTTCDAALYNMEFLLGAIRDKEDAQGNPTGEEYLRTDLSSNPYSLIKEGRCGVEVIVQMDCVDDQGNPLPERLRINLNNPDLLYDNRPWLKRMKFDGGATTSRITGKAVRFNIENNTISLHNLRGTCYPSYSIGMFYAPIQHFMEDIILREPAKVQTDYCIFPLSRNCDVPMKGLIHASAAKGAGFNFLGTTIPFTDFNGFINISDVDVYLDRMNAQCWGGVMNGSLRIDFSGERTSLDGYFVASNMNLKDIVASYGEDFSSAVCNGYIRFQAPSPDLDAIQAYGEVSLKDGDLMQIGLFRPIRSLLDDMPGNLAKLQQTITRTEAPAEPNGIDKFIRFIFNHGSSAVDKVQDSAYSVPFANHFIRYGIDEAHTKFDITKGHLITRDMKAMGYNLNVKVDLDINLDTLTMQGDLWPKISSVPTAIISPITILSDFLIDIDIYGELVNPQWKFGLSKKLKGETPSLTETPAEKK